MRAGHLTDIMRYPVKSAAGESVQDSEIGVRGLAGDRRYAVMDQVDGKIASAKHPRKWGRLLEVVTEYRSDPSGADAHVALTFPDGTMVDSSDDAVHAALSAVTGRDVRLTSAAPPVATIERMWTAVETSRDAQLDAGDVTDDLLASGDAEGTFFDFAPIHLVTTATLQDLTDLQPTSVFDPRRFRPNLVIDSDDLAEQTWVGHLLHVGEVVLRVHVPTPRCVVTTVAQPGLAADSDVLRAVAQHSSVPVLDRGPMPCVGAYAEVVRPGVVRVGDAVTVR